MTIPSGILKADVDKHEGSITQYLAVIDKKTGTQLMHPRFPNRMLTAAAVDVEGSKVTATKLDDEGRIVRAYDEFEQEEFIGLDIELHWLAEAPDWMVKQYSNQELPVHTDEVKTFVEEDCNGR